MSKRVGSLAICIGVLEAHLIEECCVYFPYKALKYIHSCICIKNIKQINLILVYIHFFRS